MNDYERIAKVIRYLDRAHHTQPDLPEVAQQLGISPFHFHRLFHQWAGITPKAFVQCLTMQEAKAALCDGRSVLDTAIDVGLSGPGRLHDLCVKLTAATPGEIKSGGRNLTLHYGLGETPFGQCLLGSTERGLCHLAFVDDLTSDVDQASRETLKQAWPQAKVVRDDEMAVALLAHVFQTARPRRSRCKPTITAWVKGSAFQVSVWRALLAIEPGHLTSYGELAKRVGRTGAARAVGSAVGANPLALLIPCHRVIRETGVIGQYRWGHGRKRTLIAWERALHHSQSTCPESSTSSG